jgi:bacteriorhodopsin
MKKWMWYTIGAVLVILTAAFFVFTWLIEAANS